MDREAWDRQPSESSRAFALFIHYRDAGPLERTFSKVARDFNRSKQDVQQIGSRNNWAERAAAWDAENERVKRAATVRDLEQMARRQVLAGQLFQSKAIKNIRALTDEDVETMTVLQAVRLYDAGLRIERIGRGEPLDLDLPYNVPQAQQVATDRIPIAELLRRNPTRVGPVVEILAKLTEALPELTSGVALDVDETDLADLLEDDEEPIDV